MKENTEAPETEELFALLEGRAAMAWELKPLFAAIEMRRNQLHDLVQHMWIHNNYECCGYAQMTSEQKALFDEVRTSPFSHEKHDQH